MKKFLLTSLLLAATLCFAQQMPLSGIHYYDDKKDKSDAYLSAQCQLDLYLPENQKAFATVIWFHGGGLTQGRREIPEALKAQGFAVIGVGYRLSPKAKVTQCIEDAASAIAWTFANIGAYGGDPHKLFVSGHSAGGYLALMTGLDKKWLKTYNLDANDIAGLIPFSAQCVTHFTARKEKGIGEKQATIDELAPIFFARADAPPLLLITGDRELELLGRYEENAYLARMMKINGHPDTKLIEIGGYGHNMVDPAYPILVREVKRVLAEQTKKE